jgi:hypothetical protein
MQQTQQPTSISTTPPTTPTIIYVQTPTPTSAPPVSVLTQQMISLVGNALTATADQWNWAYTKITGQGVDQQYKFNFDTVYGPIVPGAPAASARSSGMMTPNDFLARAQAATPGMSGIGRMIWQRIPTYKPTYAMG